MTEFYLNVNNAAVSPALVGLLLMRSGLQWEMHPAQEFSLEMMALRLLVQETVKADFSLPKTELGHKTQFTLMGIPIFATEDYPMNLIRLMYNGEEVTRMENVAIPTGFENFSDYDAHVASELEKMRKIGHRTECGRTQDGNKASVVIDQRPA